MQSTPLTTLAAARTVPPAPGSPRLAEFHTLVAPYGDPRAARTLAETLRDLAAATPHALCLDLPEPDDALMPLGLNLWPSLAELHAYMHRSGPVLRQWRLGATAHRPLPRRVLWWTAGCPDLAEAVARLRALTRDGPGPGAFTARSPCPAPRR